jgi:arylsulfatase A-like enzyme
VTALAIGGWLSLVALTEAVEVERPNILLVLSDDHSVPHLGCYEGGENCRRFNLTPNLDALAADGMRFDRAYTAAPQCAPSRIAIFAGRSPVGLRVTRFAQPAQPDVRFFTDVLRDNGYWVGLDGRHQHLDGKSKDAEHIQQALVDLGMRDLENRFDHFVRASATKGEALSRVGEKIDVILDEVPAGKPFFLYFGFNQAHRAFKRDYEGIDPAQLELPPDWPDLPEVRLDYARYLAEVRDLDKGVGLVEKVLVDRGIKDNTLVIFMGDNGESLLRGKGTLFDRGIHVPLIIRWPGKIRACSTSDALISGVDLAPTILAAAGVDAPKEMSGVNFLPELLGQPFTPRKYVFAERGYHAGPLTRTDGLDLSRCVISERYHYVYNALPDRNYTPVDMDKTPAWNAIVSAHHSQQLSELHDRLYFQNPRPVIELYDIEKDPYQVSNLVNDRQLKTTERTLRDALDRWMIREGDYLPLPSDVVHGN